MARDAGRLKMPSAARLNVVTMPPVSAVMTPLAMEAKMFSM